MEFDDAKEALAGYLRGLDAAGSTGFEGLMRDVLSSFTGQQFRLAKSGPQAGSDLRNIGANTFKIALEAKRYGEDTRLPLDQLEAKVVQASKGPNATDLWILAATREIAVSDIEALAATGIERGVTAIVLDWPTASGVLPELAVLCADSKAATAYRLGRPSDLDAILVSIAAHEDFPGKVQALKRRLTDPDIGYAAANETMRRWTQGGMSDRRNAASRLGGQFNSLLEPGRPRIQRHKYLDKLDNWLTTNQVAVLTSNEGMGKTWLFLSWWNDRVSADANQPLMFFVPAKDVSDASVEDLLARLLHERFRSHTREFWYRRLQQWLQIDSGPRPQIILVIDGLNQHLTRRDWADFLQGLFDERINGRVATLLSSWPDHWRDLQKLGSLVPQPIEIQVDQFDDDELDALLMANGLSRRDFGRDMLEVLRVPRLSHLAIELRSELAASGDITPERLAVEDWKRRIELRGSSLALDDDEFKLFVKGLGEDLQRSITNNAFTRSELLDRLGRDSGKGHTALEQTVSELVAGRWLEAGDAPHRYRVSGTLVPFALGLTLSHQLRDLSDQSAAEAVIAKFMDPFRGQSLGVAILRAGLTACLLDIRVLPAARRVVLSRWIDEQNFGQTDFDAFWRLLGLDTDLFLQLTEELWLSRGGHGVATDEVLIKGLARAYSFPEVGPKIRDQLTKWLSWFWSDPYEGLIIGQVDQGSDDAIERRKRTQDNWVAWAGSPTSVTFPMVERAASGDPSWLSHRAFGVISYLPRGDFLEAFGAWAITRAIMGMPRHLDELAWVLRVNGVDTETASAGVVQYAERLLSSSTPLAVAAGAWLLEAAASIEAEKRLSEVRLAAGQSQSADSPPFDAELFDPSRTPTPEAALQTAGLAELLTKPLDPRFGQQRDLLAYARRDPQRLRDGLGEIALHATASDHDALKQLLLDLYPSLAVLTAKERSALMTVIREVLAADPAVEKKDWWQARLLDLQLLNAPAEQQIDLVLKEGFTNGLFAGVSDALLHPTTAEIESRLADFPLSGEPSQIINSLKFLGEHARSEALTGITQIPTLLSHQDAEIRKLALIIAARCDDEAVLRAVVDSSWDAKDEDNREQRYAGSICMLTAARVLGRPELLKRADEDLLALDLENNPEDPAALQRYAAFVKRWLEHAVSPPPKSTKDVLARQSNAMAILVNRGDASFMQWLDEWLARNSDPSNLILMDHFPVVVLCEALVKAIPEKGLPLWRSLIAAADKGMIKQEHLLFIPFLASPAAPGDTARDETVPRAITDYELAELVRNSCREGHEQWLANTIIDRAKLGTSEGLARSLTMLGFADLSDTIDQAWLEVSALIPSSGWLANVHGAARACYDQNRWARHWYAEFVNSTDNARSLAAFTLMASAADRRALNWIKWTEPKPLSEDKENHWHLNVDVLNKGIKARRKKLKDTLFWTKTMTRTLWPWL